MSNVALGLWEHAEADPSRPAVRGAGEAWSYGQLRERAAAAGGALRALGVIPGDRVMLVAPSVPEFVAAYVGALAAGAIAVTVNTMAPRPELEHVAKDAEVACVLGWQDGSAAPRETATGLGISYLALRPGLSDLASCEDLGPVRRDESETALLLYTSGTTGRPKGAQLTHGNLAASSRIFREVLEVTPDDRLGTALPLFHVFAQTSVMGLALSAGASFSILERFEAEDLLGMLRRDRLTTLSGVPTMWNALLQAPAAPDERAHFASLRLAASGGAPLTVELLRAFEERFGCVILEGYGLTESSGAATFNGLRRRRKPGAVGIALPECQVELRDDRGEVVPVGEVGEVHVRGPVIMRGYWRRTQATTEALSDGWLRTGDLGVRDADGDFFIVDRKKDMIIRGGYNVYPREVEEVLHQHPDIAEVAVVGVPDEHFGEEVGAALVLRTDAELDRAALRDWAKQRLSAYKVPRVFGVYEELPKGPTGKVLKRAITMTSSAPTERPAATA